MGGFGLFEWEPSVNISISQGNIEQCVFIWKESILRISELILGIYRTTIVKMIKNCLKDFLFKSSLTLPAFQTKKDGTGLKIALSLLRRNIMGFERLSLCYNLAKIKIFC